MVTPSSPLAIWVFHLATNSSTPTLPKFAEFGEGATEWREGQKPGSRPNVDGFRGVLWLPSYLRRDATAQGLLLLSI